MSKKKYPDVQIIMKIKDEEEYIELKKTDEKHIQELNERALNSIGYYKK